MPAHFQTRVLLLEDNTGDYLLVQAGLAHAAPGAYLLTRAECLAEAFTRLETETFDVILSDLSVRDSEGLLTVKAFVSQAPALPLVVLTGLNDSRIGEAAILLGAQDYLVKDNVDGAMLARTLRYAIDRKRLELRLRDANATLEHRVAERTAALHVTLAELQESLLGARAVTDTASDAIITSDADGKILRWNRAAEAMFGYTETEVRGQSIQVMMPPRYREAHAAGMARVGAPGVSRQTVALHGLTKDGREFPLELSLSDWQSVAGRRFTGIMRDVTDRRRAEQAERESATRLSAVFHASPIGIVVSRVADGRLLELNDAALRLYGYEREDAIGRTVAELGTYSVPAQREALLALLRAHGGVDRFPVDFRRRGGELGVMEVSARIVELQGEPCLVGMIVDMTEQNRLAQVHLQSQKLESLGTLAGGIAHDFNNILSAIQGNAELAMEILPPDHLAVESLREIAKASQRAAELVRRIVAFGRPRTPHQEPVDLRAVVSEVLKLLRSTLPTGIALNETFAADTPNVLADAGQIHEVLVNLTTNAAYAIGSRTGAIEYLLEPAEVDEATARSIPGLQAGHYARLTVTDSGCGMDAATQARAFDAFFTTKPLGEGTGLGLSMVHGIMRTHGGAVELTSTPGSGSAFSLLFPATTDVPRTRDEAVAAPLPPARGQRILYVDDEEALVRLARHTLGRAGHIVLGFSDPQLALAAFRADPRGVDAVVSDLTMPGMNGFELAREILALRPEVPVFLSTGHIRADDQRRADDAGIWALFPKPLDLAALSRALDACTRAVPSPGVAAEG